MSCGGCLRPVAHRPKYGGRSLDRAPAVRSSCRSRAARARRGRTACPRPLSPSAARYERCGRRGRVKIWRVTGTTVATTDGGR